jgi:hypothetical protein
VNTLMRMVADQTIVAMLTSRYLAVQAQLGFSFCQSFLQIAILYQESYCFQTDKPIREYVDARVVMLMFSCGG